MIACLSTDQVSSICCLDSYWAGVFISIREKELWEFYHWTSSGVCLILCRCYPHSPGATVGYNSTYSSLPNDIWYFRGRQVECNSTEKREWSAKRDGLGMINGGDWNICMRQFWQQKRETKTLSKNNVQHTLTVDFHMVPFYCIVPLGAPSDAALCNWANLSLQSIV